MDVKTLEYMGERVDKARKLTKDIDSINGKIKHLANVADRITSISIAFGNGGGAYLGKGKGADETESVLPIVRAAMVEILTTYRDQLQEELDEL